MNIWQRDLTKVLVLVLGLLLGLALLPSHTRSAAAHPIGNFTINLYSHITVERDKVSIMNVVEKAEIATFQEFGATLPTDHGTDYSAVLELARAAYAKRPTIHGADILSWALYQAGQHEEARTWSEKALALETKDALLYYHAGMIAHANGDRALARQHLERARAINPHFSLRYAPTLQATLDALK
jgi:tetratricopeptide (TPR) repeat protein